MKKYTPNFTDPRVKRKLISAFNFAITRFSYDKPRFCTRDELDKHLGYSHKQFGGWVRNLLIEEDPNPTTSYRFGRETAVDLHKKYKDKNEETRNRAKYWYLRKIGVEFIAKKYNLVELQEPKKVEEYKEKVIIEEFTTELETGNWKYEEKSNRLWNPAQRIPNALRESMFAKAGYVYNYDIVACAPTLIKQYAVKSGMTRPTPALDEYLKDRSFHRNRLAQLLNVSVDKIKEIINGKLAGGKIGADPQRNKLSNAFNNDWNRVKTLKEDAWFIQLCKDIKKCWDAIKKSNQLSRLNSQTKWRFYFQLENAVMMPVRALLKKETKRYFLEHDGFRCDTWVDPYKIKLAVKIKTGYSIDFEYEHVTV